MSHGRHVALLLAIGLGVGSARAGTVMSTMSVAFNVPSSCAISTTPMNFGTGSAGAIRTATSVISISCTTGAAYNVAMNGGRNYTTRRRMSNDTGGFVAYRLTKTAGGVDWGDSDFANTMPTGSSVSGTGNGATQGITVFGETVADGDAPPGSYTDSIVVTVNF